MTREEAIKELQSYADASWGSLNEAFEMALSSLRPVSREQVEKVWRGEWINTEYYGPHHMMIVQCKRCKKESEGSLEDNFCPHCGAPMTDEAVEILIERMEELKNEG